MASLSRLFAQEQRAFLGRSRADWDEHLDRTRAFLGEGLDRADRSRPVLILGAGSGLEIPWRRAPKGTTGWDADPLSRLRTLLRHGRWAPWVGGDLTDAFKPLREAAQRAARESWSGKRRSASIARVRLEALLPSLPVEPVALRRWIAAHSPGTILAANVMGQLAPVAMRVVEAAFAPHTPWEEDPDRPDPLAAALEAWVARLVVALLAVLEGSEAELWLVHDRAVLEDATSLVLGDFAPDWRAQLGGVARLEAWDPLGGVDVLEALHRRPSLRQSRWLWRLGPDQLHLMEALAFGSR